LFLLLRAAFEAFLSEFLVVGVVRVFKVGSTVNWWWDRCADVGMIMVQERVLMK
jgi:hypothetical protein